jgi:TPR repeat protein
MMLGQMYHDGIGMSADQTEAYAWSEVAILEGSAFAKNDRDASFHDLSEGNKNDAVAKASEILKIIKDKTAPVKVPTSK